MNVKHSHLAAVCALVVCGLWLAEPAAAAEAEPLFHDSHFHLTNYVQKGPTPARSSQLMGNKVGRVALFGIPLQQTWSYENSGDFAPTYYLQTDAPLYYYSFTDACDRDAVPVALGRGSRALRSDDHRLQPRRHVRRGPHPAASSQTFPASSRESASSRSTRSSSRSKVAGDIASLTDPALDRIFEFAAEIGLVVLIHNDIDMPFAKAGSRARLS